MITYQRLPPVSRGHLRYQVLLHSEVIGRVSALHHQGQQWWHFVLTVEELPGHTGMERSRAGAVNSVLDTIAAEAAWWARITGNGDPA